MGTEGGSPSDGSPPCENVWGAPRALLPKLGVCRGWARGSRGERPAVVRMDIGRGTREEEGWDEIRPGTGKLTTPPGSPCGAFIAEASTSCSHPSCSEYLQTMET